MDWLNRVLEVFSLTSGVERFLVSLGFTAASLFFFYVALFVLFGHPSPIGWFMRLKARTPFGLYPFLLWLAPTRSRKGNLEMANDRGIMASGRYQLFLYPDNLLLWHWIMAIIATLSMGPLVPWRWLLIFPLTYYLFFWWLYHASRRPVLEKVLERMPAQRDDWWVGLVERIDLTSDDSKKIGESLPRADRRVLLMTGGHKPKGRFAWMRRSYHPPGWRRPLRQYGVDSPEERLLLAAMSEFFVWGPKELNQGLLRFAAYWCAPVWFPYLMLYAPLLWMFLFPAEYCDTDVGRLVFPLILWAVITLFFFASLEKSLTRETWSLDTSAMDEMPLIVHDAFTKGLRLQEVFSGVPFKKMVSLLYTITFGMYVLLLTLLVEVTTDCSSDQKAAVSTALSNGCH